MDPILCERIFDLLIHRAKQELNDSDKAWTWQTTLNASLEIRPVSEAARETARCALHMLGNKYIGSELIKMFLSEKTQLLHFLRSFAAHKPLTLACQLLHASEENQTFQDWSWQDWYVGAKYWVDCDAATENPTTEACINLLISCRQILGRSRSLRSPN